MVDALFALLSCTYPFADLSDAFGIRTGPQGNLAAEVVDPTPIEESFPRKRLRFGLSFRRHAFLHELEPVRDDFDG